MGNNKYTIKYLPTFSEQLNNILYYFVNVLKNEIAAKNFYKEVFDKIEKRSFNPTSFKVFKISKLENINWYRIYVKNFTIFYVVRDNVMEIRRIYYSRSNFNNL